MSKCKHCQEEIIETSPTKNKIYCTKECKFRARYLERKKPRAVYNYVCAECALPFETIEKRQKFCTKKCAIKAQTKTVRKKTLLTPAPKVGATCKKCNVEKENRKAFYCVACKKEIDATYRRNWKIKKGLPVLTDEKNKARKEKEPKIIKEKEEKKARILTKELKQTTSKIIKEKRLKRLNAGVIEDGRGLEAVENYDNNYRSRDKDRGIIQRELTDKEKNLIDEFFKQRGQAVYIKAKSEMLGFL